LHRGSGVLYHGRTLPDDAAARRLTVGGASAEPGGSATGWIEVPDRGDPGTRIPVTVVHGARPGPVLALVAGTHGYEYTSVLALQRLRPRLDPRRMAGAVVLVHLANPPGFYGRRVYYGPDGKNLNRVYPGAADGTISERIAHALTREVIDRCTHLADMHCGDGNEACRPYAYWIVSGNGEVDAASRELALAYGLDHIVVDRGRPRDPARSAFTSNTAVLRGKPAVTTESGGMGRTDDASVGNHERGAASLIAHLGIQDLPSARVERPVWIDRNEVLRAPATGLWHPVVEPMQHLAAGTLVGRLTDPHGALLHEVRAPFAGIVLYVVATPPVTEGEPLGGLGGVATTDY
jgi:predicted deacylase